MARPCLKGGGSLRDCGRQCIGSSAARGGSTCDDGVAVDLPEWGSVAASSYGRDCMTSAPAKRSGAAAVAHAADSAAGNGAAESSTSNQTSQDNPLAFGLPRHQVEGLERRFWSASEQSAAKASLSPPQYCGDLNDAKSLPPSVKDVGKVPLEKAAASHTGSGLNGEGMSGIPMWEWPCEAVTRWLFDIGFPHVADRFADEAIDGEALLELKEEDLSALGIFKLGERKRFMKQVRLNQAEASLRRSLRQVPHLRGAEGGGNGEDIVLEETNGSGLLSALKEHGLPRDVVEETDLHPNITSPEHPLALGHLWGNADFTDGPSNGPAMRAKQRLTWRNMPPPA
mmetsp:Transcript_43236/g.100205  ORF Transcript_43236/g.100205 Transcript_43236/m.100205 type:complete len:341 (+) Transcript_43236:14-1036(+)